MNRRSLLKFLSVAPIAAPAAIAAASKPAFATGGFVAPQTFLVGEGQTGAIVFNETVSEAQIFRRAQHDLTEIINRSMRYGRAERWHR